MAQKNYEAVATNQTLTASYVAGDGPTLGYHKVGGETFAAIYVDYTTGAAETNNTLTMKIEFSLDGTNWYQQSYDSLSSGVNSLSDLEHTILGAAAATSYKKLYLVPMSGMFMRASFKESGVAANAGTVSASLIMGPEGVGYNHQSVAVSMSLDEFPAAALLADNTSLPTTTQMGAVLEAYDGTNVDLVRAGVTSIGSSVTGFLNTLPEARYNATPTTRTEGQFGPLQADVNGALNTNPGALSSTSDSVTAYAGASSTVTGSSPYFNAALSNTVVSVKGTAGNVYGWDLYNSNAAAHFVQIFNVASGSVTLGTTTPSYSIAVRDTSPARAHLSVPITHGTAISAACTATATGSGAPAAADNANIFYS